MSLDPDSRDVLNVPIVFSLQLLDRRDSHMTPATRAMLLEIDSIYHDVLVTEGSDPVLIFFKAQKSGDAREASLG